MHLLVRETHGLEDDAPALEPDQTPADLILLSFSNSDLTAAAAAWQMMAAGGATLRLTNLDRLRHPMSVDLYLEQVASGARCIILRLLGGLEYWRYGAEELAALCRERSITLAILPGDGPRDPKLDDLSTAPPGMLQRLHDCFQHGGPTNLRCALQTGLHLAGRAADLGATPAALPEAGLHLLPVPAAPWATACIVFYRSHLLAGDIQPIEAMAAALAERGIAAQGVFVSSLKHPGCADFIRQHLRDRPPHIVLNATAFSAQDETGHSPLEVAAVPVLQLILSGASRAQWRDSSRGLSPTDLAMQVVLPELDGRLGSTAISFKSIADRIDDLQFAPALHQADADGIALAADRAAGWARLAVTAPARRRIAIVLSDYPGQGGRIGHAVGLDTFASLDCILQALRDAGYDCGVVPDDLVSALCQAEAASFLSAAEYRPLFATLPAPAQQATTEAWGDAENGLQQADGLKIRMLRCGQAIVAIQPDRAAHADRKSTYHDPNAVPCHAYIGFYLYLRQVLDVHAILHLGTHGTLEWLPGKSAALSATCWPNLLIGGLPVAYPFIVSNPGEAAFAKRRLGAVTIGHMTPELCRAGTQGAALELERLLDEYTSADGLDRRRTALLRQQVLRHAAECGVLRECGAAADAPEEEQLAQLDAYLCDVKEMQIRDGLHVFGQAGQEMPHLLAALDGRFVPPGPAGSPSRGRVDVHPTGRNLFTANPRAIPTQTACTLAEKAVEELLRQHCQQHGDWPRSLVIDLWGSTTMRTGGEDLALAFLLTGARPVWDAASHRVTGYEILPLAVLNRPRIDVTLRISGVFRDMFEAQIQLFDSATRAIARRDEAPDWNGLAQARDLSGPAFRRATTRIYGPANGAYGTGLTASGGDTPDDVAMRYLAASGFAYGEALPGVQDPAGFADRVAGADAFLHTQDHAETDLLETPDHAAHEGGFAAAARHLGNTPALYHLDTTRPEHPKARALAQEIARVVRARGANPRWIAGMMQHGYRGASEMANTLDSLYAFALTVPERFDAQFDMMFDATIGDDAVDDFLRRDNPAARDAMFRRFRQARDHGLWQCSRNSVAATLEAAA